MAYPSIESWIRQQTGLEANLIGVNRLVRAVRQRMDFYQLDSVDLYLNRLKVSAQELDILLEQIVIPETWFFRSRESFHYLKESVLKDWLPQHSASRLRVLSVPCSTGEEPYSIAIALREIGLTSAQFQIDAIDISRQAIAHALRGIYSPHSFRGNSPSFGARYFEPTPEGLQIQPLFRDSIHFSVGNLLQPAFWVDKPLYDIIFCRNLLIYFDGETRQKASQMLYRALKDQGVLFVGHAEMSQIFGQRFTPVQYPFAFAYRKSLPPKVGDRPKPKPAERSLPTLGTVAPQPSAPGLSLPGLSLVSSGRSLPSKPQPTPQPATPEPDNLLAQARTLADQGNLSQAIYLCEIFLRSDRTNADVYTLLGQLQQASGQEVEAEQSFQKAIYLQPRAEEALVHLALLREQQGDTSSATLLWQRVHRLRSPQADLP
ncbi:protein-glutamate O-methyltransferase CheR [Geitlerinema sp. PCC 7407]|uniref:CheR family methyltransferase n=1 Tax=Geitlerinema sp. PCC 7407 TaxID=1173025 RepID=UPI00029FB762|nr:protein-glutamate O-methyltransferase CheR [Geitlerinema sp. PCC 7407]AFY66654.1 MCP methyltransferase, CheR-type [Geitlerinema sp. PCC 7407]